MVSKFLLITALLVATASATPITIGTGVNFGQAMYKFLTAFKSIMPCGYAAEGIPVMAPLVTEFQSFSYESDNDYSISGNVSNINIIGLNNFHILDGSYDASSQHANFDLIFPEIQILGAYEVEGFVSIGGIHLPINQNSLLNEKLEDLRFVGSYNIESNNSSGLQLTDVKIEIYLGDFKLENWNSLWSVAANEFANDYGSAFLNYVIAEYRGDIGNLYSQLVVSEYNKLLANVNLSQVIDFLLTQAEKWEAADC
ncbi:uncharacterized protein Dwil_GK12165 [Drosophila willistoni]|uniref:Uncharacterized protein n=1 Tax=Drosophila willistoni TaxID=7260 RepID=B4N963_DROWI|nr:uncharacterized protein LOC6646850 [Drosophila willistoni]EDW81610.1 uncharacterized protein Dwil_GK12165 [Drosophila willistoni]